MIAALLRNRWALVPIILLASAIAFSVLTVMLAIADHPLGVEPQYDTKAAHWQSTAEQATTNDRLRWLITPDLARLDTSLASLRLRVEDRHTIPIDGARVVVEYIPIANADQRGTLTLAEIAPGEYAAAFEVRGEGAHEFRISIDTPTDRYTDSFRRVLPHPADSALTAPLTTPVGP